MNNQIVAIDNDLENLKEHGFTFEVTWDMGRRCNFDCTYCPDHRHNNTSPHSSLETLIKTSDFVFKYRELLEKYMKQKMIWSIGFTGGEPTNNPNFLPMCEYIHSLNVPKTIVNVTTNGAFSENYCSKLMKCVDTLTLSYHCEADTKIKQKVIDRIYQMQNNLDKDKLRHLKINLMFHAKEEWFNECIELADRFTKDGIKFVPRIIGESYENDRYNHRYTQEQHDWFRNYWANKNKKIDKPDENKDAEYEYKDDQNKVKDQKLAQHPKDPARGERIKVENLSDTVKQILPKKEEKQDSKEMTRKSLGRPCCGARTFFTLNEDNAQEMLDNEIEFNNDKWQKSVFACSTEYKDWSCMINWNWLHIEQEYDNILHHQTCRANFGGTKGPIGKISECDKILDRLERQLSTGTMPVIVCPNKLCGCGLCVPKSKHHSITEKMFEKATVGLTPIIGGTLNE